MLLSFFLYSSAVLSFLQRMRISVNRFKNIFANSVWVTAPGFDNLMLQASEKLFLSVLSLIILLAWLPVALFIRM